MVTIIKAFIIKNKQSYRTQIFFATVILITIPMIAFGIFISNKTLEELNMKYQIGLSDTANQISINIDAVVSAATSLSTLHLLNDDIYNALISPYDSNSLEFSKIYYNIRKSISMAVQLNPNIVQAIFLGKNNHVYDYGIISPKEIDTLLLKIDQWKQSTLDSPHNVYVAPIHPSQEDRNYSKDIIPVVQILKDIYSNKTLGVLYVGLDFKSMKKIIEKSGLPSGSIAFFDENNQMFYHSDKNYSPKMHEKLTTELAKAIQTQPNENNNFTTSIVAENNNYSVYSISNQSTGWKIVHYLDNSIINTAYKTNIQGFLILFIIIIFLDLFLAFIVSQSLTKAINKLCKSIDECEHGNIEQIQTDNTSLNWELTKITNSYNGLNNRLTQSVKQNYTIKLNEKQMQLKMLQNQINPHFLYNTLNLISSLANINNVPEIKTIATSISDLLRYNLKSGPIVTLKEETNQIDRYIKIQQIRFPDKFIYECSIPTQLCNMKIPIFILQPIVENAVLHGLSQKESDGYIAINLYSENNDLHILISDNGIGIPEDILEKIKLSLQIEYISEINANNSVGILNAHQRIQTYYSKGYGLSIISTDGSGTIVDIKLPLNTEPFAK